jgi:hypothetical protein
MLLYNDYSGSLAAQWAGIAAMVIGGHRRASVIIGQAHNIITVAARWTVYFAPLSEP